MEVQTNMKKKQKKLWQRIIIDFTAFMFIEFRN